LSFDRTTTADPSPGIASNIQDKGFSFGVTGVSADDVDSATSKLVVVSNEADATGPYAVAAARVFDSFDDRNVGTLPESAMESLLDELGEAFHGDQMEAQIALVDADRSG
jgi:hypothetical protein